MTKADGSDRPEYVPGYKWNAKRAGRVCDFIEKFCHHARGKWADKPFTLLPWQRDFVETIYGWEDANGNRRFRTASLFVPKKNGKSSLAACLTLVQMFVEGEPMAEIVGCASDRAQAAIVFRECAAIVRASPHLKKVLEIIDSRNTILYRKSMSRYYCLSGEHHRSEGINASCVIFDEIHAQKDDRLWNAVRYSTASRENPLLLSISTAGADRRPGLPWWDLWTYTERVSADPSVDPSFYGKIYAAKEEDDEEEFFSNEKIWHDANPSLGHTISMDSFKADAREAKNSSTRRNAWLRYRLNLPRSADNRFVTLEKWNAGDQKWSAPLEGRKCYCAVDLSSTRDLTAFTALFPVEGSDEYDVFCRAWVPKDNILDRVNRDHVPYDRWLADGFLHATPGNICDYQTIRDFIQQFSEKHQVEQIAFDRWQAQSMINELSALGLPVVGFGQGFASFSAPMKEIETLIENGKLRHDGHPVLAWNATNVITEEDAAGNIKPSKKKSSEKIDMFVTLLMSLGLHQQALKTAATDWNLYEL